MDGTLLDSKGKVSTKFYKLFDKLKYHDIKFIAASGRQYFSIAEKLKDVIDDIIIVSENGAFVKIKNEDFLTTCLAHEEINTLVYYLRDFKDIEIVVCAKRTAYTESKNKEFLKFSEEYYSKLKIVNDLTKIDDDDFFKIAIYCQFGSEQHLYPHVKHLEKDYQVKVSGDVWIDISNLKANKGFALNELQKSFGINKEETLVFGDYNNDLEMFEQANIAVAVENAHPNIKKIATYITKSNDEQGVEIILEQLLDSKGS